MNKHHTDWKFSKVMLTVIITLFLLIGGFFSYIEYSERVIPPKIIDTTNQDTIYVLTSDGPNGLTKYHDNYGNYLLYPVTVTGQSASKEHPAYIASTSVPLEPYLNKKIKIKGDVVWTDAVLKRPGFQGQAYPQRSAGVKINSIQVVE